VRVLLDRDLYRQREAALRIKVSKVAVYQALR
jgi:predicted DNA-binding protein (UPF0251 family)